MNTNIADKNTDIAANATKASKLEKAEKRKNAIFFNAREWKISKDCADSRADRTFYSDPFGKMSEIWTLGDWSWKWSQIETKDMMLQRNTDYSFFFWLNGGENEDGNETCQFEIMFDNEYEGRSIYKLNRSYIKSIMHYKGWYLYEIPFNTGEASYTKFRFCSQRAYMAILPAEDPESYKDLPIDAPPSNIPQRHNIVFTDGFPHDEDWSWRVFGIEDSVAANEGRDFSDTMAGFAETIRNEILRSKLNMD